LIPDSTYRIGTVGWSVPAKPKGEGTHLYHYSRRLPCVEINSTFYRTHRSATWAKWAAETPADFRFSIKAPKSVTHEAKLHNSEPILKAFFEQIEPVREKAGPILFQLPPSLAFDNALAEDFFIMLRTLYDRELVLEPRHASWFTSSVNILLKKHMIARVAADPPKGAAEAAEPGGDQRLTYYRLHGYPRIYYSSYDDDFLATLAAKVKEHKNAWIIFDNTALSHAYSNAIRLKTLIEHSDTP
jgi:uncharacterized protein YecE (DUF72 family)